MNNIATSDSQDEIAVIGMTCRFPGARSIDEFWQNLQQGVESVSIFSEQDLIASGLDSAVLNNPNYVRASAVVEDIELFDAAFFGYTPREAEIIDPQHRIFLECAWEALESAGYATDRYKGRIGVYAGVGMNTYLLYNLYPNPDIIDAVGWMQAMIGNEKDHLATRVSYKLNLKGPGVSVGTACSTSLVAIHLACQSLLNGECDLSLAGGVSLRVPQKVGYVYQEGGIASPDGHCRAFDAKAQGTLPGNGSGVVVLKRLEDALADGDTIHAVIKGSAINNDGSAKIGYTAPSVSGQVEVIAEAQALAGVPAEAITYIETHGTGTSLGDPIEIQALTEAFRTGTDKKNFCAIGSVKTNIGHLDIAAGVAGFIKAVLALKHKMIPPSLNFNQPNPRIDFENSPFYVNTALSEWEANDTTRHAGITSLGLGGTNAHVILAEAPPISPAETAKPYHLLPLSAKTEFARQSALTNVGQYLKKHPHLNPADVAYTLQVGRKEFEYRGFLVCHTIDDAVCVLEMPNHDSIFTASVPARDWPIVFLFPGQGMQHVTMALGLYQSEPVFRKQVDRCAELLKPLSGFDLRKVLYPAEEQREEAARQLNQMDVAQPVLFTIEYALAKLWMEWGVSPDAMIGHSMGEYVAACLADVFPLEGALTLVATRGKLMQELPEGAMLSVSLPSKQVLPFLNPNLSLAASNSATDCVISGFTSAVAELEQALTEKGIFCRRLNIPRAAHSFMLDPILEQFACAVQKIPLSSPRLPFVSNVTGTWITEQEATDPGYWVKHLRQTVRFAEGLQVVAEDSAKIMLELAPGRTLTTLARRHLGTDVSHMILPSLPHPQDTHSDIAFLLHTCGQLWSAGVSIDWQKFYANEQRLRIPLPTYPFERKRYWINPRQHDQRDISLSSLEKKADIADWFSIPSWKRSALPNLTWPDYQPGDTSCWLVFTDELGLGQQIIKRLEQAGESTITVAVGDGFRKISDRFYTVCPQQRHDYDALLNELSIPGTFPTHILHLWSVIPPHLEQSDFDFFETAQSLGFYSLLFLVQAIGEQNIVSPLQIVVLSNNLQEVLGGEMLYPARATVLGLSQVIQDEYPNITCRSIDVILPASAAAQEKLVAQLLAEFRNGQSDWPVAYRGSYRWLRTTEPVRLQASVEERSQLRERGVYLIIGGFGGIGSILAEHLARMMQARLVLTGRSALPDREEWEQWLATHDEQDATARKIRQVQLLEGLGAEILAIKADVTNPQEVQALLGQIQQRFGKLNGLIHAAGVPGAGMIQLKNPDEAASVLAAKVKGMLILEAALKNTHLDFMILCSSLSSILGGLGLADYCASNAFLDHFAFYNTSKNGTLTISINWDTWQGVGMAVNATRLQALSKIASLEAADIEGTIQPQEGVEAFRRILSWSAVPQVIVSTKAIQTLHKQHKSHLALMGMNGTESGGSPSVHVRPEVQTSYIAPSNQLEQQIANFWQRVLGIEKIGVNDNFFEIGGDSVMIIQIIRQMHEAFQVALSMHLIFETPTIAGLAEVVAQKQMELIDSEHMAELIKRVSQMSEEDVIVQLRSTDR